MSATRFVLNSLNIEAQCAWSHSACSRERERERGSCQRMVRTAVVQRAKTGFLGQYKIIYKANGEHGPFVQIITVEDNPLNQYDIFETEFGYVEPVLEGSSNLMETFHIEKISRHLPPRTVGHPWRLAYNTSLHGFSLKTLYRKVAKVDSPVLLILKDTHSQVFGALTSHPPKSSDLFFGTGETFLFTFNPDFKIFPWTGENSFFIKGGLDSLAIGGGSGRFGLWLDEDLNRGRSNSCPTFNNSILSKVEDFNVRDLEVWTFR
uniref:TLDc domain-containing protein n=1 Tax=Callorhinchus milii TaxID=7868 RepID=A0A4W3JBD9_CALMI